MRMLKGALMMGVAAAIGLIGSTASAGNFLIENVTLIDGTGTPALPGASVLVNGNRITAVSPTALKHDAGVEVIDGRGKFLIPGLMDSHIHLSGGNAGPDGKPGTDRALGLRTLAGYLWSGITTIYDSANNPDYIFPLRDEEKAGKIVSPRIFSTGKTITVPGGYGDGPGAFVIADWAVSRPQLDAYFKQRKPDMQKVLIDRHGVFTPLNPSPSVDLLKNIVRLANENGVPTTVHAASEEDYNDALEGGIDNFAHVIRYPATDALIRRVSTRRIVMATTLAVFNHIARVAGDPSFMDEPLYKAIIDPKILEFQKVTERKRYIDSGMSAQYTAMRDNSPTNVLKIFKAGGTLALGTDRAWGASTHMEIDLLHKAGIPLFDIIKMATLNGAIYIGHEKDFGSIERGKFADLLLLDADPTQDAKNFQAIAAVFKNGERIDRSKLDVPANKGMDASANRGGRKK